MTRLPTTRALARILATVLACLVALSACGIATDEMPTALAPGEVPASIRPGQLPTPTVVGAEPGASQPVYMIAPDNRLIAVFRDVAAEPDAVMADLLLGATRAESGQGIQTAITRNTSVVSIEVDPLFQLATVTLGINSLNTSSQDRMLAFGQMVFTLTELDGVESVLFLADLGDEQGIQALNVETSGGQTLPGEEVQRNDYAAIDPGRDQIEIAFPDDEADTPTAVPGDTIEDAPVREIPIWVVNADDDLVPVTRQVRRNNGAILQTLFDGLLTAERQSLRSAIPEDALARSVTTVEVDEPEFGLVTVAIVDLAAGSLPVFEEGDERALAVGQIVFTLTGLAEIDQVILTIDGEPTSVPTQDGLSEEYDPSNPVGLRRADYSLYAPSVAVIDAAPTPVPGLTPDPTPTPEPTPE